MAWVPYRESVYFPFLDVQFFDAFTPLDDSYLPDGSTMGAPVAADAPGGRIGVLGSTGNVDNDEFTNRVGFSINLVGAPVTAVNIRVTPLFCDVREFAWGADTNKEVLLHEPAQFIADTGFYVNQSATFKHTDPPGNLDDVYSIPVWTPRADIENVYSPADSATFLATASLTYRPSAISYNTGPGLSAYSRNEYSVFLIEIEDPEMTSYNCDCDDENPSRTFSQMREDVAFALGFRDPTNGQSINDSQMIQALDNALNFIPVPVRIAQDFSITEAASTGSYTPGPSAVTQAATLTELRTYLNARLGYAANATAAPGHYDLLDAFINEAQLLVWHRYEYDSYKTLYAPTTPNSNHITFQPPKLVNPTDKLGTDAQAVMSLALGNAKAHFGHQDAKLHLDEFERYMRDLAARIPPGYAAKRASTVRIAYSTAAQRVGVKYTEPVILEPEQVPQLLPDNGLLVPTRLLSIAMLKSHYGQSDAKVYYDLYEQEVRRYEQMWPRDAASTLDTIIKNAQEQLYRKYTVLRTERIFTWQLQAGVKFYDLPGNEEACTKRLDPRKISWVGVSDESNPQNGWWRPLVAGIKPEFYSIQDQSSWPTHYEIRQCIEVWPTPDSSENKLRIKGHFGLAPLNAVDDKFTIDDTAVYLFALANAKAHYRQPDAAAYMKQAQDHIRDLTAGLHQTRRYVPREEGAVAMPKPQWTGPI